MDFVVNGVCNMHEICEWSIIEVIDISKIEDITNYENVYENKNVNIFDFKREYKNIQNVEILSIDVVLDDKKIKKIKTNNNCIYTINFIYYLKIKSYINSKIEEIEIADACLKSVIYKDIEISNLDVYTINLDLKNINNKIGFFITFIIIDKSNTLEIENLIEENQKKDKKINKENYSYIDIKTEFI